MKRTLIPALLLTGMIVAAAPGRATDTSREVIVANLSIHPVRVGAGGLTAEQRVGRINERLNTIIAHEPLNRANIRIRVRGNTPSISVGRYLVTSVTQADADANRSTKWQLANRWLREYRRVLPQARPGQNWGVVE